MNASESKTTLAKDQLKSVLAKLGHANRAAALPGEPTRRQPVHTVYGGAQLFKADTAVKLGTLAQKAFAAHAGTPTELAGALGISSASGSPERQRWLAETVFARVAAKLAREPVEDFRIDFEDGFGSRPDAEEDAEAVRAATELARGLAAGTLPPMIGVRVKAMTEELKKRAVRTLDLFMTAFAGASGGKLPPRFAVTLPKVTIPEQVEAFAAVLTALEKALSFPAGALELEIMIEHPAALRVLPELARAGGKRLAAAHLGAYDYTAARDVVAAQQTFDHPACDFARQSIKAAYAGHALFLSDGATNIMPVGEKPAVHRAWRLSYAHIQSSLRQGFYQGWDLHPAQIPVRYAAVYAFFLDGLEAAGARLKTFMEKAAQATLLGAVFDDAATGQGLLNYFLRALNCGALTLDELGATGLTLDELRTRSFHQILAGRRK
jgi:hypothetical protein